MDVGAYGADSDAGLYHDLEQDETGLPPSEPLVGDEAFALRCIVVDDAATCQERTNSSTAHLQLQVVQGLYDCGETYFDPFFYTFNLYMSLYN